MGKPETSHTGDLGDILAFDRALSSPAESVPSEFVKRLIEGEGPVRVYRDWRGLTQAQLAKRSGVNRVPIAEIEAGRETGSVETVKKIAAALGVSFDDLV